MKHVKAHAHEVHRARHAHLGVHSSSKHPGYAHGGHPTAGHRGHSDVAEDRAIVREMVQPHALKRKHGGRTEHKGKKHETHVNIMVHPGQGAQPAAPAAPVAPAVPVAPSAPVVARPAATGLGGIGGTAGLPVRRRGGRV